MEIKAIDGKLSLASLFGSIAVGYGIGAGVIFIPMFLLIGGLSLFVPAGFDQSGQAIRPAMAFLPMIIMVPFILAMQAVMFGGLVMLGLAIYRNWGLLRVSLVRETPAD